MKSKETGLKFVKKHFKELGEEDETDTDLLRHDTKNTVPF